MAKKNITRRPAADGPMRFNDAKYGNVRLSTTYDYNELTFTRASSYLGGTRLPMVPVFTSIACLIGVVAIIMLDSTNIVPAAILAGISIFSSATSASYSRLQASYARKTSLAYEPGHERRMHVAVGDSQIFWEDSEGRHEAYDLADLAVLHHDSDGILAGFGQKRYIYFPRNAMSEGRFNTALRILQAEKDN